MFIKCTSYIQLVCEVFTHQSIFVFFQILKKMEHFTGRYLKGGKSLRDFYFCLQITYNGTLFVKRIRPVEVVGFWQSIFNNWENIAFCTIFQK